MLPQHYAGATNDYDPTDTVPQSGAKAGLVSTVSLGLLAGPIALAAPAQAADYSKHDTCTVTAQKPDADKTKHDRKFVKVDFSFKIHCDTYTKVYFNQKMFQQQGKWYKQIGQCRRFGVGPWHHLPLEP